jgi:hypothetical protein
MAHQQGYCVGGWAHPGAKEWKMGGAGGEKSGEGAVSMCCISRARQQERWPECAVQFARG